VVADSTDAKGFHIDYKNGHIDWSPASGAHKIAGPIYDKWMTQGGPKSGFAYPITDEAFHSRQHSSIISVSALSIPHPKMGHI